VKSMLRLLSIVLISIAVSAPLAAREEILSFDSCIEVLADGSMQVNETITVRAEGDRIKRGIYRDFPTDYRDAAGNRYVVGFEVLRVTREGYSEPFFTEKRSNGVRVYIGDKNSYLQPGEYRYEITYRTNRQLGFFAVHDELYWNVTGNGWGFPINSVTANVVLPQGVAATDITVEAYTGASGAKGSAYRANVPGDSRAGFVTTEVLAPNEGLTIVVGWPKGFVDEPGLVRKVTWLLQDNAGLLIALATLFLNVLYLWLVWKRYGVDPEAGPVFPHYEPPAKLSPGACRYIQQMSHDNRAFTAAVMSLAVKGYLKIHEGRTEALKAITGDNLYEASTEHLSPLQKKVLSPLLEWAKSRIEDAHDDTFVLERLDDTGVAAECGPGEKALLRALFSKGQFLLLSNSNHKVVSAAMSAHKKSLGNYYKKQYFLTNGGLIFPAFFIGVVGFLLAGTTGEPAPLTILALGGNVPLIVVFLRLLKAPTLKGRLLLNHIEGFTMYLTVAEAADLARIENIAGPVPEKTTALFEGYLPYAVAFDVDQPWASQFESVFARLAAEQGQSYRPHWYNSNRPIHSFNNFASNLSGSLGSAISASATAPGSSSGGGGGGSSGGGGGGGGGGGW
jgi:hypothetical protein